MARGRPRLTGAEGMTEKESALLTFLRTYIGVNKFAPTVAEIKSGLGWRSNHTVFYYLRRLEKLGRITRQAGESRTIVLTGEPPVAEQPVQPVDPADGQGPDGGDNRNPGSDSPGADLLDDVSDFGRGPGDGDSRGWGN